jgi:hypothetical protein
MELVRVHVKPLTELTVRGFLFMRYKYWPKWCNSLENTTSETRIKTETYSKAFKLNGLISSILYTLMTDLKFRSGEREDME